jgi:hypothetical protein
MRKTEKVRLLRRSAFWCGTPRNDGYTFFNIYVKHNYVIASGARLRRVAHP